VKLLAIQRPGASPSPQAGAKAQIVEINLPRELEPGRWITGFVLVDNVGDERGKIACVIYAAWEDRYYGGWVEADPTARIRFDLPEGLIQMPDEDARMSIMTGVLLDGWDTFRKDDERSWTVRKRIPPELFPWWWMLALGGGAACVAVIGGIVWVQERRREEELMLLLAKRRA